ncbi:hypothetical protein SUGI_0911640 [Cryptomeria japonica]|nr:hypothetical protein SUGI_0911640 [Cryptomeria japonica]
MGMKGRWAFAIIFILLGLVSECQSQDAQLLSKSQIEDCSKTGLEDLDCTSKLVLEIVVPSGTKGSSNTIEVPIDKARNVSSGRMQIFKDPYKIAIEKSSINVIFTLSYVMDANFQPHEIAFSLSKCHPANDYRMGICSRMRDRYNNPIEGTEGICCRCGNKFRLHNCRKKSKSVHCLRYSRRWYRTFALQQPTLQFYVKIIVSKDEKELSIIYLGPAIPQGVTYDKFLKASIQGDYINYQGIPKMENFYLSAPKNLEGNGLDYDYNRWMLIERTRYTFGNECNKIGIGPKGFRKQIGFCTSPMDSCIHNQLFHFYNWDQSAMRRNQLPQYVIARRFERINDALTKPQDGQLSLGITEELMTNILLEIRADDIRFIVNVYGFQLKITDDALLEI